MAQLLITTTITVLNHAPAATMVDTATVTSEIAGGVNSGVEANERCILSRYRFYILAIQCIAKMSYYFAGDLQKTGINARLGHPRPITILEISRRHASAQTVRCRPSCTVDLVMLN